MTFVWITIHYSESIKCDEIYHYFLTHVLYTVTSSSLIQDI